jgi:hypothetical protein
MKPAPPVTTHFMIGRIHRETAAEQALLNRHITIADYQRRGDSASITNLFRPISGGTWMG